jgi:hypothetical protein
MLVPTRNIIYKVVSREITKERLAKDSSGGIFVEEKVVESVLDRQFWISFWEIS